MREKLYLVDLDESVTQNLKSERALSFRQLEVISLLAISRKGTYCYQIPSVFPFRSSVVRARVGNLYII